MANHYMSREIANRLHDTMKCKNISTNQICRELNIAYPDFKAMLEGRQPCFNKWQRKIASALGVERSELFKEFTTKSSEQQHVLNSIRAEIVEMRSKQNCSCADCLDIIDKYRTESE